MFYLWTFNFLIFLNFLNLLFLLFFAQFPPPFWNIIQHFVRFHIIFPIHIYKELFFVQLSQEDLKVVIVDQLQVKMMLCRYFRDL